MYSLKKISTAILLLLSIHSFSTTFINPYSVINPAAVLNSTNDNGIMIKKTTYSIANNDNETSMSLEDNQLQYVYESYFLLKESLVKTDSKSVSINAEKLLAAITAVKMENLKKEEQTIWNKLSKSLLVDAENIYKSQDMSKQREFFKSLSKNLHDVIKVSKSSEPVYYQYCPMQDANWLSKEKEIKNPYYGAKMINCGKTVETL